jgi:putative ABC transport system permease protein
VQLKTRGIQNRKITLSLQPLDEIALGAHYVNEIGASIPIPVVWILAGLAFVVILSACFNYTNLSIARSMRRSREVGIRKIVGALKGHVLGQFVAESVIISLLALVFSLGLFLVLRTQFLALAPQLGDLVSLELSPQNYSLFCGDGRGRWNWPPASLPALFFSRIQCPSGDERCVIAQNVFKHVSMRKALIVIQYTISLIFIAATLIGYSQYRGFISFDLGFTTENILNIRMQGRHKAKPVEKRSWLKFRR